jgi:acetoin utilization deacetylase AcuC-like enzyme
MNTLVYTHSACLKHEPGPSHPESPQRLKAVLEVLEAPAFKDLAWRQAPMGTRMQAMLVHDQDYVDSIADLAPDSGRVALDGGDTVMSSGSWEAVMRCIGAACAGVDAVMAGEADNVFCATRPCGHHAEPDRAMGFCIFNQAAIAAVHALQEHALERVAVVDFDVHHGNGTQAAFFARPELFYASSHQSPLYPGTGSRSETGVSGNIVNVPLRAFKPDFIIISAGFDAHRLDPLAGMNLEDDDFGWVTERLMAIADEQCAGRIVSILEGGYSGEGLAGGTAAHVAALMRA